MPDPWWQEGSAPESNHFNFDDSNGAFAIPIGDAAIPKRDPDTPIFKSAERVQSLLKGMRENEVIPPVLVWSKEKTGTDQYVIRDGCHRYHLSVALGFPELPVIVEDFDMFEYYPDFKL